MFRLTIRNVVFRFNARQFSLSKIVRAIEQSDRFTLFDQLYYKIRKIQINRPVNQRERLPGTCKDRFGIKCKILSFRKTREIA